MKTVLISIFSGALMLGVAYGQGNSAPAQSTLPSDQQSSSPAQPSAQQTATESATQARPLRIAPGSVIPVSLTKTVDAKKVKTGDEVVAKVTQDMKSNAGEVIVAKDTEVVGHVTEAQARNKEQKESQVGITFDHAVMKDGSEMQMPMSIQAVVGSQNSGPQNSGSSAAGNSEAAPSSGTGGYPSSPRAGGMGGSMPSPAPRRRRRVTCRAIRRRERVRVRGLPHRQREWWESLILHLRRRRRRRTKVLFSARKKTM